MAPYICFSCRKSFKRPPRLASPACPDCGEGTVELDQKFKAPARDDVRGWRVVRFLVERGFRFDSVWEREGCGRGYVPVGAYPTSMALAKLFVSRYAPGRPKRET